MRRDYSFDVTTGMRDGAARSLWDACAITAASLFAAPSLEGRSGISVSWNPTPQLGGGFCFGRAVACDAPLSAGTPNIIHDHT